MKKLMTKYVLSQILNKKKEDIDLLPNQTGTRNDLRVVTPEDIEQNLEDEFQYDNGVSDIGVPGNIVDDIEDYEQDQQGEEVKERPHFDNVFDAVRWSMDNNESMRIHYVTLRGNHFIRDIEPHGQHYSDKSHRSVVVTWDDTMSDVRSFVMQNILEFEFLGKKFSPKFFFSDRSKYVPKLRKIRHK